MTVRRKRHPTGAIRRLARRHGSGYWREPMKLLLFGLLWLLGFGMLPAAEIIRPRVVVVAMFEPGKDTGDAPGELQYWVEREKLDRTIPLPLAYHDVRANADGSVIAIVTGVGNTR